MARMEITKNTKEMISLNKEKRMTEITNITIKITVEYTFQKELLLLVRTIKRISRSDSMMMKMIVTSKAPI